MNKEYEQLFLLSPIALSILDIETKHAKYFRDQEKKLRDYIDFVPTNIKDEFTIGTENPTSVWIEYKIIISQGLPDNIYKELIDILVRNHKSKSSPSIGN